MSLDASPNHVGLVGHNFVAILERCSTVVGPRHLEHSSGTLDALNSKSLSKALSPMEIQDELADYRKEERLLLPSETIEVCAESGEPRVRWQRRLRLLSSIRRLGPLVQRPEQLVA
jgi:hypothetical protein